MPAVTPADVHTRPSRMKIGSQSTVTSGCSAASCWARLQWLVTRRREPTDLNAHLARDDQIERLQPAEEPEHDPSRNHIPSMGRPNTGVHNMHPTNRAIRPPRTKDELDPNSRTVGQDHSSGDWE